MLMMFLCKSSTAAWRRIAATTATNASTTSKSTFLLHHRWASTLVLSDPLNESSRVTPGTQSAVTAASLLQQQQPIHLLVVGSQLPTQVPLGVTKIIHASSYDIHLSESVALAVQQATDSDTSHVVTTASKFGSTVAPRAAALLNVSPITDIIQIISAGTNVVCA
jgi:electron transfer flavoprotein alpha subunit